LAPCQPALVEDKDGVGIGDDLCGDLVEMKLHGFGVAERQNEGSTGSVFGADRTEQIGRLGALMMRGSGMRAVLARRSSGSRCRTTRLKKLCRPRGATV
jgi:hypothetical protein